MIVVAEQRATHAWRKAHVRCITPSDTQNLFARSSSARHAQLIDRLVLDFEGVANHTTADPEPWEEQHELDLIAALACFRKTYPTLNVRTVGFVLHDVHSWLGASPHGLIDPHGVLLLRPHRSLRAFHDLRESNAERARMQLLMFVTGRQWCATFDFWDGSGRCPDKMRAKRTPFENEWLVEHVFPKLVATWREVRAKLANGALRDQPLVGVPKISYPNAWKSSAPFAARSSTCKRRADEPSSTCVSAVIKK